MDEYGVEAIIAATPRSITRHQEEPLLTAEARRDAQDEITRLIYAYSELLDSADFAGMGTLFERGVFRPAGDAEPSFQGAELTRFLQENVKVHGESLGTRHCVTNLVIDVADDGTQATAKSYVFVFQATASLPLQPVYLARYRDTFALTDGAWHFVERVVADGAAGDLSDHVVGGEIPAE